MNRGPTAWTAFALVLGSGEPLPAQTITAVGGNATFTFNSGAVPTTATGIGGGSSNLDNNGAAAGGDSLFENWWWYRVDGVDTREYRFSAAANPFVASGDTMTGTFQFEQFRSDLQYRIIDGDGPGTLHAVLRATNLITNTSALTRSINVFAYADLDMNGEITGSYSYSPFPAGFQVNDAAPVVATGFFRGFGASAYQAAVYTTTPGLRVRGLVADEDIDNLNNTVTGSPGDFTGAFQWTYSIAPGESFQAITEITINFPVSPGTVGVFALSGAAVMRRRR